MKKTYELDLRDFDISRYTENAIVFYGFDHTVMPVGRAKISENKTSVEVTLIDATLNPVTKIVVQLPLELTKSYLTVDNKKVLLTLNLVVKQALRENA